METLKDYLECGELNKFPSRPTISILKVAKFSDRPPSPLGEGGGYILKNCTVFNKYKPFPYPPPPQRGGGGLPEGIPSEGARLS